jgi:uncharacterized protein GlcG (DUF336 family)
MIGLVSLLAAAAVRAAPALPPPMPYGAPIRLAQARAAAAAAEAEAVRRGLDTAAIVVVDPAGRLIYFARQDNASFAAYDMASAKARAAARYRRATSVDAQRLAAGQQIVTLLPGMFPAAGGRPIVVGGKVIGAIGESGGADDAVAEAGANAVR